MIVISHDRNLARHVDAPVAQDAIDRHGQPVIAATDRGWRVVVAQEPIERVPDQLMLARCAKKIRGRDQFRVNVIPASAKAVLNPGQT